MLLGASAWMWFGHFNIIDSMHPQPKHLMGGIVTGLGLSSLTSTLLKLANYKPFKWLVGLKEVLVKDLAPMFAGISNADIILLGLASGFCEEIAFRGVLQHQVGIWWSSAIFGALHCPSIKQPQYAFWAFAAGLLFGYIYLATNDLWTPIVAHMVTNFCGLWTLRALGQKAEAN